MTLAPEVLSFDAEYRALGTQNMDVVKASGHQTVPVEGVYTGSCHGTNDKRYISFPIGKNAGPLFIECVRTAGKQENDIYMAVSATDFEPKFGVCDVEYAHERVMVEKALPNGTKRLEVAEITLPRMDAQAAKKTCDMGHTTHQVKGTDYVTITINGSDLVRDCTYRIGISMYGGGDFKVTVTSGVWLNNVRARMRGQFPADGGRVVANTGMWNGRLAEGRVFEGTWYPTADENLRTGSGVISLPNGELYNGQWLNDQRAGDGIQLYPSGDRFRGTWEEEKRVDGAASLRFANGDHYEGNFVGDKMQGHGEMRYADTGLFVGEFANHARGKNFGKMLYADKNCYFGQWNGLDKQGDGEMYYSDGQYYTGTWSGDQRTPKTGHGTWKQYYAGHVDEAKGDTYTGQWDGMMRHGEGEEKFANGDVYTGQWVQNCKCGQGRMKYGKVQAGSDPYHKFARHANEMNPDTFDVYTGQWAVEDGVGVRSGNGKLVSANGNMYEGEWKQGEKCGEGVHTYLSEPANTRFVGQWNDFTSSGDGVRTSEVGHTYTNVNWNGPGGVIKGHGELRYSNVLENPAVREAYEKQITLINCGDHEKCEDYLKNVNKR